MSSSCNVDICITYAGICYSQRLWEENVKCSNTNKMFFSPVLRHHTSRDKDVRIVAKKNNMHYSMKMRKITDGLSTVMVNQYLIC